MRAINGKLIFSLAAAMTGSVTAGSMAGNKLGAAAGSLFGLFFLVGLSIQSVNQTLAGLGIVGGGLWHRYRVQRR